MEKVVPVDIEIDNSIRAKVTDICGMACDWCHNEGTPVNFSQADKGRVSIFENTNGVTFSPGLMLPDDEFKTTMTTLNSLLEIDELHWTGGEPTTYKNLAIMTQLVKDSGLKVKMTSNGEMGEKGMSELFDAGLDGINFSIFGITPEEIAQVQGLGNQSIKKAEIKLMQLDKSIKRASELGIVTKANIVMGDESDSLRILKAIDMYSSLGVEVRILPDLSTGMESYAAIYNLLGKIGAIPLNIKITAGSSNSLVRYKLPNGTIIGFKQIRNSQFSKICDPCGNNNEDDCKEGYYGIRLYVDVDNVYRVGVCLQRMDLTVSLEEFKKQALPEAIKKFRKDDFEVLLNRFKDRIE